MKIFATFFSYFYSHSFYGVSWKKNIAEHFKGIFNEKYFFVLKWVSNNLWFGRKAWAHIVSSAKNMCEAPQRTTGFFCLSLRSLPVLKFSSVHNIILFSLKYFLYSFNAFLIFSFNTRQSTWSVVNFKSSHLHNLHA